MDKRLEEREMTRADLARALNKTPQAITRALNGNKGGGGQIPGIWLAILEALEMQLEARPCPISKISESSVTR